MRRGSEPPVRPEPRRPSSTARPDTLTKRSGLRDRPPTVFSIGSLYGLGVSDALCNRALCDEPGSGSVSRDGVSLSFAAAGEQDAESVVAEVAEPAA